MKQGWQEITLGKICDILDFKRKPISKQSRIFGKYPYYGATGIVDYVNDYIFNEQLVLIGEDGAKWGKGENSSFIVSGKYWVNNHAHVIRPNRNTINDKYLVYFLNFTDLTKHITGATVQKLNQDKLKKISIFLPRLLSEQKRIVKILDKAFEDIEKIKENAKQNLQNSKDLFDSYLNKTFTENTKDWKEKKIEEVCDIISGTTPDTHNKLYWNGRNFWVTPAEINEKSVYINNTERKITDLAVKECSLRKMPKGTIIFSSRAPIGKIAISNIDLYCNQGFKNFICSQDILNTFLYYFLLCKKQYIISLGKGTTFKEVSKKIVANIQINFPNISIQKQIVKKLDMLQEKTKKLEELYNKKLQLAEELKQSILHKAFNGDL